MLRSVLPRKAGPPNTPESSFATNDPLPKNDGRRDYSTFQQANLAGYRQRPEDTARTLRGEWVYTGYVGYIDDDDFLFVGVKDMVVMAA